MDRENGAWGERGGMFCLSFCTGLLTVFGSFWFAVLLLFRFVYVSIKNREMIGA